MFGRKKLDDIQLLEAVRNGDENALIQVYRDSYTNIRNYIFKNSGKEEDVDDVVQDAVVNFWEKVTSGQFKLEAKISTYIMAVAKNIWLKKLGKNARSERMDAVTLDETEDRIWDAVNEMDLKKVVEMVKQLGDTCKEVLHLFYFEGLDMETIAASLGYANADTAKAKKHQCFKKLREKFLGTYRKEDFLGA